LRAVANRFIVRRGRLALGIAALAAVAAGAVSAAVPASAAKKRAHGAARSWEKATRLARPAFHPRRRIDVSSAHAFWRAWRHLRPGVEIDVHHVVFTGETTFRKRLPGWAEVHFDRRTMFRGKRGGDLPAVWIDTSAHIRFYGGTVLNPGGAGGILIYDSAYVTWRDFLVHWVGGSGLVVQGIHGPNTHLDLEGRIAHWGDNLAHDPHSEKGTGLHGALLGDAKYGVKDSRFVLDLHDGPTGSGVEAGGSQSTDGFWNNTLYLRCRNLTMRAVHQTGGNCIQLWGDNVTGNRFAYIEADDLQGLPYQTDGLYDGQSLATDTVVYGRASHTNLNSRMGDTRWDPHGGTVFRNVSPRP
jgi:hypothetical protein